MPFELPSKCQQPDTRKNSLLCKKLKLPDFSGRCKTRKANDRMCSAEMPCSKTWCQDRIKQISRASSQRTKLQWACIDKYTLKLVRQNIFILAKIPSTEPKLFDPPLLCELTFSCYCICFFLFFFLTNRVEQRHQNVKARIFKSNILNCSAKKLLWNFPFMFQLNVL